MTQILWGLGGSLAVLAAAWLLSTDRRAINWRTVGVALVTLVAFAFAVLRWSLGRGQHLRRPDRGVPGHPPLHQPHGPVGAVLGHDRRHGHGGRLGPGRLRPPGRPPQLPAGRHLHDRPVGPADGQDGRARDRGRHPHRLPTPHPGCRRRGPTRARVAARPAGVGSPGGGGFTDFGPKIRDLSDKTVAVVTFALCGFANFGSFAILLGDLAQIAPRRRGSVARLGVRAVLAGTLADLLNAAVAGMFV